MLLIKGIFLQMFRISLKKREKRETNNKTDGKRHDDEKNVCIAPCESI